MLARIVVSSVLSLATAAGTLSAAQRIAFAETAAVEAPAPMPLPPPKPAMSEQEREKTLPAKQLFGAVQLPSIGRAVAIGHYHRGCLAAGVELPLNGPNWQVMRVSRNRNWGHPTLIRFLEKFAPAAAKASQPYAMPPKTWAKLYVKP